MFAPFSPWFLRAQSSWSDSSSSTQSQPTIADPDGAVLASSFRLSSESDNLQSTTTMRLAARPLPVLSVRRVGDRPCAAIPALGPAESGPKLLGVLRRCNTGEVTGAVRYKQVQADLVAVLLSASQQLDY